jgi:hypothetical protein
MGAFAPNGTALGATGTHPPRSGGIGPPPFHGRSVDAFRPAWASWIAADAPHTQ